jgi:hypothetical protein
VLIIDTVILWIYNIRFEFSQELFHMMLKQSFIFILILVVISLIFFVNKAYPVKNGDHTKPPNMTEVEILQPKKSPNENVVKPNDFSLNDKLSNHLIKAGWDSNSARIVITLNQEWFEILQTNHSEELDKQINLLKKLGKYDHLMPLFKEHPETAALLAGADDPEYLDQFFKLDQCYDITMGLFTQHAAPEDAVALANALKIHHSLICHLIKRGLIGSQTLFIFPRNNEGAKEYDHWLAQVLDNAPNQSDEKLSALMNLLFEQGTNIRGKMIDDPQFRYTFRNKIWPKFVRVSNKTQQPFELYLSDPHLWDLLALPQGEQLLEQWLWFLSLENINNLTLAQVLFGEEAYPSQLHPFIIDAILDRDANTLISLLYFGHAPLFIKFMQRELPEEVKQKAFNILIAQGRNYRSKLEDWNKASYADLYFELVNEDSNLAHTIKKMIQGREVSGGETFWAALNMVDIAVMAVTLGTGAVVTSSLKLGAKKALKQKIKIVEKVSNNVLMSTAQRQFIEKIQSVFRNINGKMAQHAIVEITPLQQLFTTKMNVNRKTRRINRKLDVRLFIRKNAKVLVNVNYKKLSSAMCLFFKITTIAGFMEENTIGKEVTCGLAKHFDQIKTIYKWVTKLINNKQFNWQKNNSAWFLMNASKI